MGQKEAGLIEMRLLNTILHLIIKVRTVTLDPESFRISFEGDPENIFITARWDDQKIMASEARFSRAELAALTKDGAERTINALRDKLVTATAAFHQSLATYHQGLVGELLSIR